MTHVNDVKSLTAVPASTETVYTNARRGLFANVGGDIQVKFCDSSSYVTLTLVSGTYYNFVVTALDTDLSSAATEVFVGPQV